MFILLPLEHSENAEDVRMYAKIVSEMEPANEEMKVLHGRLLGIAKDQLKVVE